MQRELPAGIRGIIAAFSEGREPSNAEVAQAVSDTLILLWHTSHHLERIASNGDRIGNVLETIAKGRPVHPTDLVMR